MSRRTATTIMRRLALVLLLFAGGACAPDGYRVHVTALRDPTLVGRTYWLEPGEFAGDAGGLQYRGFAELADRALRARGYQPVDRATAPHLVIYLDYGIGPPSSATVKVDQFFGTRAVIRTAFTTWVRLSAVEGTRATGARSAREVWSVIATTEAYGRELQTVVPVLLASEMDFFATHAPDGRRLNVPFGSQRVAWLREANR